MLTLTRPLFRPATLSLRTYATHAPSTPTPSPYPVQQTGTYDPEVDPQLADLGYPKVPNVSNQLRNPRGWWDTQERINFGEPVPESYDALSMWSPDVHKIKPSSALSQLLTMFGVVASFAGVVYFIQAPPHALPRAYPEDGSEAAIHARPFSANEVADE